MLQKEIILNQRYFDTSRLKGVGYMVVSAFCFAGMTAIAKGLSETMHVLQVSVFRVALTALLLAPYMCAKEISFLGRNKRLLFVRGTLGFIALCLGFYATSQGALGDMTAIWKSAALFSPIFALWFLGERISFYQAGLILLGFAGILTVARPSAGVVSLAGGAALGSAVLLALIAVSIRKLHETEHAFTIVQAFCLYGTLLGSALFFPFFKWPNLNELVLVALMGAIGTIGQTTFTMAFKYEETAIIQPYSFFEIVFACLIGWFYWGQAPAPHAIIGMALIVSSGALLLRSNRKA